MDEKIYTITMILGLLNGINTGIHGVCRINIFNSILHFEKLYFTLYTLIGFATVYFVQQ